MVIGGAGGVSIGADCGWEGEMLTFIRHVIEHLVEIVGVAAVAAARDFDGRLVVVKGHDPVRGPQHVAARAAVLGGPDDAAPVAVLAELDGPAAEPSESVVCAVLEDRAVGSHGSGVEGVSMRGGKLRLWRLCLLVGLIEELAEQHRAVVGLGFGGGFG